MKMWDTVKLKDNKDGTVTIRDHDGKVHTMPMQKSDKPKAFEKDSRSKPSETFNLFTADEERVQQQKNELEKHRKHAGSDAELQKLFKKDAEVWQTVPDKYAFREKQPQQAADTGKDGWRTVPDKFQFHRKPL